MFEQERLEELLKKVIGLGRLKEFEELKKHAERVDDDIYMDRLIIIPAEDIAKSIMNRTTPDKYETRVDNYLELVKAKMLWNIEILLEKEGEGNFE